MTTPPEPPDPWEPFTTLGELAIWLQLPEVPVDNQPFANLVLGATALVIREKGSWYWTRETLPPRLKLLADVKAKNFYQHPTGAISETTGPISERFIEEVVAQLGEFTTSELTLIASYGGDDDPLTPAQVVGLWTLSTTRGPLETHQNERAGVIHVPSFRVGAKMIPYYAAGALGSPE